jgi:hypothetical protein
VSNPIQTYTNSQAFTDTLSVDFTTAPTVGNTIILVVFAFANGTFAPSASDTGSNSYTIDVSAENPSTSGSFVAVLRAKVTSNAGSPFSVTFVVGDGGGGNDNVLLVAYEVSDIAATQPDVTPTSATPVAQSVQPGSQTPTIAGDFAVLALAIEDFEDISWTSPAGWTSSLKNTSGSTNQAGEIMFQNLAGTTAVNPSFTSITNNAFLSCCMALYRPAGGGAVAQIWPYLDDELCGGLLSLGMGV